MSNLVNSIEESISYKIYDQNGSILPHILNFKMLQKYLTNIEIEYINALEGLSLKEKLQKIPIYPKPPKQTKSRSVKRKNINISTVAEAFPYRNANVRFHYTCKSCGRDVYITYKLLTYFADFLCKQCRKKKN